MAPGVSFPDNTSGEQVGIHYSDWSAKDKANDYSYVYTGNNFVENAKIPIHLATNDSLIYGIPPVFAAKPAAQFGASPTFGYDNLIVNFFDSSTGGITTRRWSFGDGFTDTATNPTHTYTTVDSFSVKLFLSGIGGKDSIIKPDFIKVVTGIPEAKFSGFPDSGVDTLTVQFYDSSTGNITSWLWRFGDNDSSTVANPVHKYSSVGPFSVQLIVTGPGGSDTAVQLNCIVIYPPKPTVGFSASPLIGLDSQVVQFFDSSKGSILSRIWNFGDSTTDTAKNPTHNYKKPGAYSVKLIVTGAGGTNSLEKPNYITITSSIPKAIFSADKNSGTDTLTVQFYDSSTGRIASRIWSFGDDETDTAKNPVHFYKTSGKYSVKLYLEGPSGKDSLIKPDMIIVYSLLPKALFWATPTSGPDSLDVQFHDTSTGTVTERLWDFGDGKTSTEKDPLHHYSAIDTYSVQLIVSGAGVKDSLTKSGYIQLYATRPDANFSGSPTSGAKPLHVQFNDFSTGTINGRLWDFGDGGTSTDKNPLHTFIEAGKYTIILISLGPGGSDTLKKADYVSVIDTQAPPNGLRISGKYLGGDSVDVYVDSISRIDTNTAQSIGIWYGFSNSGQFQDSAFTRWIPAGDVLKTAVSGRIALRLKNSQFSGIKRYVYCSVVIKGANSQLSVRRDSTFITGTVGMANPIVLKAQALSYSSILLTWNRISGVDSIRLWMGPQPVPLTTITPGSGFSPIVESLQDTVDTIKALISKTTYYFGVQIYGSGSWSFITDKSSANATTKDDPDTNKVVNTITLTKTIFDSATNSVKLAWTMDPSQKNDFLIGISLTLSGYPDDTIVPKQIIPVSSSSDSVTINLSETVVFDTTYYVALWLKKNGPWSFPTAASRGTFSTSFFSWEKVMYFAAVHDTVFAMNGFVRLWNDVAIPMTTDTIVYWMPADSLLNGCIPVSGGIRFKQWQPSPSFYIGLRCISIPQNRSIADVRLYRYGNGAWSVEKDYGIDSASGYVWVKTNNLEAPFIAMIDTKTPTIEVVNLHDNPVKSGQPVVDTFFVSDNIVNVNCSFRYAKGGDPFEPGNQIDRILSKHSDTVIVSTPGAFVSEDNGLRALFIVSDGVNIDTEIVSRRVIRDTLSDFITTEALKWLPLRITAIPDNQNIQYAFRTFSVKSKWTYDSTQLRLFRWYPCEGNTQKSDKWVQYTEPMQSVFKLAPGNLLWIKTKKSTLLDFGRAITPSLTDNFEITLVPNNWNDIALPMKFDVVLGDILNATNRSGQRADSLHFYEWAFDDKSHYFTKPIFLLRMASVNPTLGDRSYKLLSKERMGYSIYNPLNDTIRLIVPPIPSSLSAIRPAQAKKTASQGWAVKITGQTKEDGSIGPVFCGYSDDNKDQSFFPMPPSWGHIRMGVCDEQKNIFGHTIKSGTLSIDGGVRFVLVFKNNSANSETVEYTLENEKPLPEGMLTRIYDPETGNFDPVKPVYSVTVSAGSSMYRQLLVGTKTYLLKMQKMQRTWSLNLTNIYPNPAGRNVRIQYSLPGSGLSSVKVSIISLSGRIEFDKLIPCRNESGLHEMLWDGKDNRKKPVAAGIYIVKLDGIDDKSKTLGVFKKRLTYLP